MSQHQHRPLRIACLHGYKQNAQRFRQKTGGLRKTLERDINLDQSAGNSNREKKPLAELVYIDAPFVIEKVITNGNAEGTSDENKDDALERTVFSPSIVVENKSNNGESAKRVIDVTQRTWWTAEGRKYFGWEQSLDFLRSTFAEKKFEGILGFSQGGIMASLICALRADKSNTEFSTLRFAILMSTGPSRADAHQDLFEHPVDIPSLHVWGTQDEVVAPWISQKLSERFDPSKRSEIEHKGGHLVPNDAASRSAIRNFVFEFASTGPDGVTGQRRSSL